MDALVPLVLTPLPLGQIVAGGWLGHQLLIQANGLSGHIDEFWPDIRDSGWVGGPAEGWERGPYWLDGIIPLAFVLDDAKLLAKAKRWVNYIVTHQHPDGWLGPTNDRGGHVRDPWPGFIAMKALTQWADAMGDSRIQPVIHRALKRIEQQLDAKPLESWAWYRWGDLLLSINWLYDRTGEVWLLSFAQKVHKQGFDWRGLFSEDYPHRQKTVCKPGADGCTSTHGVNNAMGIKTPALWYRHSHDPADRKASMEMIRMLDEYHGQINGMFTCDEHLAGKDPSQGTELCTVVEYLFSLEVLINVLGEAELADKLERIAFNALPATFSEDMWAHQYDQQVNQAICQRAGKHVWTDNGPDSNLFGLEPQYGCCAANMHQGWPKFAASLWMKSAHGGLAVISYAPCEINTDLPAGKVKIQVEGTYPFHSTRIIVETHRPTKFPLLLRIPGWAAKPAYRIDDGAFVSVAPVSGFHAIEREWRGRTEIEITFGKRFEIERRFNGSAAIVRGPLVMAMPIGEQWRAADDSKNILWELLPTTAWNYGLCLDETLQKKLGEIEASGLSPIPFATKAPPLRLTVPARRVQQWTMGNNAPAPLPPSPVMVDSGVEEIVLVPYGCTHLRIAEFPVVEPIVEPAIEPKD